MILGINTCRKPHELVLLDGRQILAEDTWTDEHKNAEELINRLSAMLSKLDLDKSQIKEIVVARGPGSFTAVRSGVTFANALAEGLEAKLYAVDAPAGALKEMLISTGLEGLTPVAQAEVFYLINPWQS